SAAGEFHAGRGGGEPGTQAVPDGAGICVAPAAGRTAAVAGADCGVVRVLCAESGTVAGILCGAGGGGRAASCSLRLHRRDDGRLLSSHVPADAGRRYSSDRVKLVSSASRTP